MSLLLQYPVRLLEIALLPASQYEPQELCPAWILGCMDVLPLSTCWNVGMLDRFGAMSVHNFVSPSSRNDCSDRLGLELAFGILEKVAYPV